jgi:hypothetical protein
MGLALQRHYASPNGEQPDPGAMLSLFLRAIINLGSQLEPDSEEN